MCDLGIENEIANQVVLVYERGLVLTKVMKDFHNVLGLHDLFQSVGERVNCEQVKQIGFACEIHLEQAEMPALG